MVEQRSAGECDQRGTCSADLPQTFPVGAGDLRPDDHGQSGGESGDRPVVYLAAGGAFFQRATAGGIADV